MLIIKHPGSFFQPPHVFAQVQQSETGTTIISQPLICRTHSFLSEETPSRCSSPSSNNDFGTSVV